jgi:CysZ protein
MGARRRASDFFAGARLLGRGLRVYGGSLTLLLLSLIPAVISFAIVASGFVLLLLFADELAAQVTWFADDWPSLGRTLMRIGAGAAIIGVSLLVFALTYTALTLIIGDPFYEIISERVEERFGGGSGTVDIPWYVSMRRNLADSLRLVLFSILIAIPLFLAGFIPIVGQTVVPVIDVSVGGWLIALEMTGIAFNRRGLRLADRRKALRERRWMALGFGVPVFLLLLIPFAAIIVVPMAIAGSTLLARSALGLSIEDLSGGGGRAVDAAATGTG